MTTDERLNHLERIVEDNSKTLQGHMLEDVRVLAQIPLRLEAIQAGINDLRQESKTTNSRLLILEQAPGIAAATELANRKADTKVMQHTAVKRLIESAINAAVAAVIAVAAVSASFGSGLIKLLVP